MKEGTLKAYIIGFISSIVLTLAAYGAVTERLFYGRGLVSVILALAVVQLIVQMFFFLHLGSESGSYWKLSIFVSTIALVLIIVIGSIWIMDHLNYRMMASPAAMEQYIQNQQGGF